MQPTSWINCHGTSKSGLYFINSSEIHITNLELDFCSREATLQKIILQFILPLHLIGVPSKIYFQLHLAKFKFLQLHSYIQYVQYGYVFTYNIAIIQVFMVSSGFELKIHVLNERRCCVYLSHSLHAYLYMLVFSLSVAYSVEQDIISCSWSIREAVFMLTFHSCSFFSFFLVSFQLLLLQL